MSRFYDAQALRLALVIAICMLLGKLLHIASPVYFALYPTLLMTKGKDFSLRGLVIMFAPTFVVATGAVVVAEALQAHPFAIWALSLLLFDAARRWADTPMKVGRLFMPAINWVLVVVFAQHTQMNMPQRIHEILLAMIITCVVATLVRKIIPVSHTPNKKPVFTPVPVTYQQRVVALALVGTGLAFLMIVNLVSAAFCMVPVIAAATASDRDRFITVVNTRMLTQVGGCALAMCFMLLLAGHQQSPLIWGLALFALVYAIGYHLYQSNGATQDIHADALLATMLPIQLYMNAAELGLARTFDRGWELAVTLCLLWALYHITAPKNPSVK